MQRIYSLTEDCPLTQDLYKAKKDLRATPSMQQRGRVYIMQQHYFTTDEEYQQWLLYQQQQQGQQQEAYWSTAQQQNLASQYPGQQQYPSGSLSPTQGYPANYGGYYQLGLEHAQGAHVTTPAGYNWPQSGQWEQPNQYISQQAHSSASGPEVHAYTALPSTPQSTIDTYLSVIQLPESEESSHGSHSSSKSRRAYLCKWPGCPKAAKGEFFKSKDNARVHVHKHFGTEKLFECIVPSCRKQFASEDAAKRHRDTTDSKAYTCAVCHNAFARKDYRDWHQSRCRQ